VKFLSDTTSSGFISAIGLGSVVTDQTKTVDVALVGFHIAGTVLEMGILAVGSSVGFIAPIMSWLLIAAEGRLVFQRCSDFAVLGGQQRDLRLAGIEGRCVLPGAKTFQATFSVNVPTGKGVSGLKARIFAGSSNPFCWMKSPKVASEWIE
jgi:hypothetical protein